MKEVRTHIVDGVGCHTRCRQPWTDNEINFVTMLPDQVSCPFCLEHISNNTMIDNQGNKVPYRRSEEKF